MSEPEKESDDPLVNHAKYSLNAGVSPMPGTTDATDESNGSEASNAAVVDGLAAPGSALIADGASGDMVNDSAGVLLEKDPDTGKAVPRTVVGSDYARFCASLPRPEGPRQSNFQTLRSGRAALFLRACGGHDVLKCTIAP